MSYNIVKSGSGYKVRKASSSETFSNKPLPKKRAIAQRQAIGISEMVKKKLDTHFRKVKHTPEEKSTMRKIMSKNPNMTAQEAHKKMLKMK